MNVPFISYIGDPHTLIIANNKILHSSEGYDYSLTSYKLQIYFQKFCEHYKKILKLPSDLYKAIIGNNFYDGDFTDPIVTDDDAMHSTFYIDFTIDYTNQDFINFTNFLFTRDPYELDFKFTPTSESILLSPYEAFFVMAGQIFNNTRYWIMKGLKEFEKHIPRSWIIGSLKEVDVYIYSRDKFMSSESTFPELIEEADRYQNRKVVLNIGLHFFDYLKELLENGKITPLELLRLNCGDFILPFIDTEIVQKFIIKLIQELKSYQDLDLITRSLYFYMLTRAHYGFGRTPLIEELNKHSGLLNEVENTITVYGV